MNSFYHFLDYGFIRVKYDFPENFSQPTVNYKIEVFNRMSDTLIYTFHGTINFTEKSWFLLYKNII